MEVYKIINIVGTSEKSFSDATKNAIIEAEKTVRNIKYAQVRKFDIEIKDDKLSLYRAEMKISFEIERE